MSDQKGALPQAKAQGKSRISNASTLFNRVIPLSLILMLIITLGLIVFAAGVILGLVNY